MQWLCPYLEPFFAERRVVYLLTRRKLQWEGVLRKFYWSHIDILSAFGSSCEDLGSFTKNMRNITHVLLRGRSWQEIPNAESMSTFDLQYLRETLSHWHCHLVGKKKRVLRQKLCNYGQKHHRLLEPGDALVKSLGGSAVTWIHPAKNGTKFPNHLC